MIRWKTCIFYNKWRISKVIRYNVLYSLSTGVTFDFVSKFSGDLTKSGRFFFMFFGFTNLRLFYKFYKLLSYVGGGGGVGRRWGGGGAGVFGGIWRFAHL